MSISAIGDSNEIAETRCSSQVKAPGHKSSQRNRPYPSFCRIEAILQRFVGIGRIKRRSQSSTPLRMTYPINGESPREACAGYFVPVFPRIKQNGEPHRGQPADGRGQSFCLFIAKSMMFHSLPRTNTAGDETFLYPRSAFHLLFQPEFPSRGIAVKAAPGSGITKTPLQHITAALFELRNVLKRGTAE